MIPKAFAKPKSQSGMSLIELMLILAIAGVVVAVSLNLVMRLIENQKRNNFVAQLHTLRDSYIAILQDNGAWAATVNHPVNAGRFQCLIDNTACTAGTVEFTPVSTENTPYLGYDRITTPTAGFKPNGSLCDTFNVAAPNAECPVQVMFTAQFMTAEVNPQVRITMQFQFAMIPQTGLGATLNPDRFNPVPFTRAGTITTIVPTECADGLVVTGFDTTGVPICTAASLFEPPPPAQTKQPTKNQPKARP